MTVELIKSQGSRAGTTATIRPGYYLVGRHKDSQIRPKSRSVSRRHCLLFHNETGLVALDLKSSRGTFINGARIESQQWQSLHDGDEIQFGKVTFRVAISEADPTNVDQADEYEPFIIDDERISHDATNGTESTAAQAVLSRPVSMPTAKPSAARQPIDHRQYKRGAKRSFRMPQLGGSLTQRLEWRVIAVTAFAALTLGSLAYQIYRFDHPAGVEVRQGLD